MKTKVEILKEHKSRGDIKAFNEELSRIIPQLKKYIKNRLRMARAKGKLKAGIYSAGDIIDEVYMITHRDIESISDEKALKIKLFKTADEVLSLLMAKVDEPKENVSLDEIIEQELNSLDEEITADAEGEPLLIEDLDDISYHLDDDKSIVLILDNESEENIMKALSLGNKAIAKDMEKRKELGRAYGELPDLSREILDLYSHAKLTTEEIAEVKSVSKQNVVKILERVKIKIESSL